ncbi:hypothetical protein [Hymenobacter sp. B81]|uniref:hypothetical protein n=1 Tax=Hymenobacter sp. B81 TaxID=3344878 RepID=UPI0037DDC68B
MIELTNLAKIVTNRRLANLPLLGVAKGKGKGRNREEELLHLLTTETNLTSLQAAKMLYGSTSAQSRAAVRKLKQRLQEKLLNHLYFLDYSDPRHPVFRRYEQQCLDLLQQARVLWWESERSLLPQLLRKTLRLAQDGDFTQHVVSTLDLMRNLYVESNDFAKYRATVRLSERYQEVLEKEREALHLFWGAKMDLMRSVQARRRLLQYLPEVIGKLEESSRATRSYVIYDALLKLQLMHQELLGNFEEIITITAEAEDLYAKGKLNRKRFDSRFTKFYSLYAHLRARRLDEGLALGENYMKAFSRSTGNWFSMLENYFLLAMHSGEYVKAGELLKRMQQNPFVTRLTRPAVQRWELMRAYLYFVRPEEAGRRTLQFAQLVQSIPDHSRDKRGYNVAILILQFLHYLRQGHDEALLARLEGLRKYETAYLRDASTLRSRLLFRLLQLTVKQNFDPVAVEEKGQALFERLRDAPPPGEAYSEIEIIPYENLWRLTLGILRQRKAEAR